MSKFVLAKKHLWISHYGLTLIIDFEIAELNFLGLPLASSGRSSSVLISSGLATAAAGVDPDTRAERLFAVTAVVLLLLLLLLLLFVIPPSTSGDTRDAVEDILHLMQLN